MTTDQIIAMQERIGEDADGFWGPLCIAGCKRYLRAFMPSPNPWPATSAWALKQFYGRPGDEAELVNLPVAGLGILYEGQPVSTIRCHRKVAPSLRRILQELSARFPAILSEYAGCFCDRLKRGGKTPSLHAYGAAIDLDPEDNMFANHWPLRSTMPLEVMEIFAREGWKPAGAFWGYDAMHFEATA